MEHRTSVSLRPEGVFHGVTGERLSEICQAVTVLGSDAKYDVVLCRHHT